MQTVTDRSAAARERRFFCVMAFAALAVVFAGFATSYYLWPITRATRYPAGQPISQSLPLVVHVHAIVFSVWVGVLVVQATLVSQGKVSVHRRLGSLAGIILLPVMAVTGLLTAVRGARDGWNPGGPYLDGLSFMVVGVSDILVFTILTAAGLACRARPDVHRRLMILGTTGGLMWPAITRMPGVAGHFGLMFGLLAVLVLAPAARDVWTRARGRWLSLAVGLGVLATFPLRPAIGNSAPWRAFAAWVIE